MSKPYDYRNCQSLFGYTQQGSPDEVMDAVVRELQVVLEHKRDDVQWKLQSVRDAFEKRVKPELTK